MRKPTAFGLTTLSLAGAGSFWLDSETTTWFMANGRNLKPVASWVSHVCDWPWLCAMAVAALIITVRGNRRRVTRLVLTMLIASTLAGVFSNCIKSVAGRTRPNIKNVEQDWYGMRRGEEWLIGENKFNSFPSSHTACMVAFVVPLFEFGIVSGTIGVLCAMAVGWARLQLGVHHLSDVTWAATLGIFTAWLVSTQRPRISAWCDLLIVRFGSCQLKLPEVQGAKNQSAVH